MELQKFFLIWFIFNSLLLYGIDRQLIETNIFGSKKSAAVLVLITNIVYSSDNSHQNETNPMYMVFFVIMATNLSVL